MLLVVTKNLRYFELIYLPHATSGSHRSFDKLGVLAENAMNRILDEEFDRYINVKSNAFRFFFDIQYRYSISLKMHM